MPLEVNEINKIDERFFFQSGNILFFFRGVDWDKSWKEQNNNFLVCGKILYTWINSFQLDEEIDLLSHKMTAL